LELPKISIVTPVYNRAFMIRRLVDAFLAQDYSRLEIVLVDDGSMDGSADIIEKEYGQNARIKLIRQKNAGPSGARNTGIENATGDVVLFVDSDVICPPDLASIHASYHCRKDNYIVQGQLVRIGSLDDAQIAPFTMLNYSRSFFDTANVSVKRKHLIAVGGFDAVNFRKGWEDLDIGLRLLKHGLKVKRLFRRGVAWHFEGKIRPETIREFYRDRYVEGTAAVAFYRKHPGFSNRMMTMVDPLFFFLDRLIFRENYLQSEAYFQKIQTLWDAGKKDQAIADLRMSAYHFYLNGIRDKLKQDGYILDPKKTYRGSK
jgi:glycosyltransferase involved in cell wall biosynthesis